MSAAVFLLLLWGIFELPHVLDDPDDNPKRRKS